MSLHVERKVDEMILRTVNVNLNGVSFPIAVYKHPLMPENYLCLEHREIQSSTEITTSACLSRRSTRLRTLPKSFSVKVSRESLPTYEGREHEKEWYEQQGASLPAHKESGVTTSHSPIGEQLPYTLRYPNNVGVLCRVRDGAGQKYSRTFREIYNMISPYRRVWFCPRTWLDKIGALFPDQDPLVTYSAKWRPWMWEGCIPFVIRAIISPASVGIVGLPPLLGVAVPDEYAAYRTHDGIKMEPVPAAETTIRLIQQSFMREAAGGFDVNGTWVPYSNIIVARSLTVRKACDIMQLSGSCPELSNIRQIYEQYENLKQQYRPEAVDAEENADIYQERADFQQNLNAAFMRIMLERLINGSPLYPRSRKPELAEQEKQLEHAVADRVMKMLINVDDSGIENGVVRLVWRKDAPKMYGLKRKTLSYHFDASSNNWLQDEAAARILQWFHILYIEHYRSQGYNPQVDIEGLKLEE